MGITCMHIWTLIMSVMDIDGIWCQNHLERSARLIVQQSLFSTMSYHKHHMLLNAECTFEYKSYNTHT